MLEIMNKKCERAPGWFGELRRYREWMLMSLEAELFRLCDTCGQVTNIGRDPQWYLRREATYGLETLPSGPPADPGELMARTSRFCLFCGCPAQEPISKPFKFTPRKLVGRVDMLSVIPVDGHVPRVLDDQDVMEAIEAGVISDPGA